MKKILSHILVFCLVFISSCSSKHSPQTLAEQAHTERKPGAAVRLGSDSLIRLNSREILRTEIIISSQYSSGEMKVDLVPDSGFQLLNKNYQYSFDMNGSQNYLIPIEIKAVTEGRYYLNLHINVKNEEGVSTRNMAVIVQVGAPMDSVETSERKLQKSQGENIISLPAQENIITK